MNSKSIELFPEGIPDELQLRMMNDDDFDPDPCPTCHDHDCHGCVTGYSDSRRDMDSDAALERWYVRRGM